MDSGTVVRMLTELGRQVRQHTVQVLDATPDPWLLWAPPGTSNHILWHAGHAVWLQDVLNIQLITGQSELPDGWEERFGMGCPPPVQRRDWPARTDVRRLLQAQWDRLQALYRGALPQRLAVPGGARMVERMIHGWHDEARHHGEMYLLWKMCRAGLAGKPAS